MGRNIKNKSSKAYLLIIIIAILLIGGGKYSESILKVLNTFVSSSVNESAEDSNNEESIEGKVTHVSDGDTVTLQDNQGKKHKIRLNGIDAPEIGQEFGAEAKSFLENLVLNKYVNLQVVGRDQFDRILGVLFVDQVNVNKELLENGFAWQYRFNNDKIYSEAVKQAKQAEFNIWSNPKSIDPYIWRKQNKK